MWKSILTALIAVLGVYESAFGQGGVSSADVNIVSVTGALSPANFTCTAVINNQNDDELEGHACHRAHAPAGPRSARAGHWRSSTDILSAAAATAGEPLH